MLRERQEPENNTVGNTFQQTEFNKSKNEVRGKTAEQDKELNSRKVVSFLPFVELVIHLSFKDDGFLLNRHFFVGLALFHPHCQHSQGYPVPVT